MTFAAAVILGLVLSGFSVVDPIYPPNAAGGGTVVTLLEVAGGHVKQLRILSGEEPFAGSCREALARWSLPRQFDGNELVVVHFRRPELLYAGSARQKVNVTKTIPSLPYPEYVYAPAYPPNALGQGSVVLRADISEEGRVVGLQVVKSMGAFTEVSKEAVKKWQFSPARDRRGRKTAGQAYAVVVFRFPTIANND